MKQTAVEFLVKNTPNINWEDAYWADLYEQAKEMEKQHIIYARLTAPSELITYSKTTYLEESEKYYYETFKKL